MLRAGGFVCRATVGGSSGANSRAELDQVGSDYRVQFSFVVEHRQSLLTALAERQWIGVQVSRNLQRGPSRRRVRRTAWQAREMTETPEEAARTRDRLLKLQEDRLAAERKKREHEVASPVRSESGAAQQALPPR